MNLETLLAQDALRIHTSKDSDLSAPFFFFFFFF